MKKFICLFIALLMVGIFPIASFAINNPDDSNINIVHKEPVGNDAMKPTVEVRRIRYPYTHKDGTTLSSGDVVVWDINSDDGLTISACTVSCDSKIAGVLITNVMTDDNGTSAGESGNGTNWGFMAVRGKVLAKVCGLINVGDKIMPSSAVIGAATILSPDQTMVGVGHVDNGAGAAYWGILGIALDAHASATGTSTIEVDVQTE
jgi:hypothetical protein